MIRVQLKFVMIEGGDRRWRSEVVASANEGSMQVNTNPPFIDSELDFATLRLTDPLRK